MLPGFNLYGIVHVSCDFGSQKRYAVALISHSAINFLHKSILRFILSHDIRFNIQRTKHSFTKMDDVNHQINHCSYNLCITL